MIDKKIANLVQTFQNRQPDRVSVVGCGKGFEAVDLAMLLHCKADAVDAYDRVNVQHHGCASNGVC
jgi:protein-L-isoaspartate O-methyltransferase